MRGFACQRQVTEAVSLALSCQGRGTRQRLTPPPPALAGELLTRSRRRSPSLETEVNRCKHGQASGSSGEDSQAVGPPDQPEGAPSRSWLHCRRRGQGRAGTARCLGDRPLRPTGMQAAVGQHPAPAGHHSGAGFLHGVESLLDQHVENGLLQPGGRASRLSAASPRSTRSIGPNNSSNTATRPGRSLFDDSAGRREHAAPPQRSSQTQRNGTGSVL